DRVVRRAELMGQFRDELVLEPADALGLAARRTLGIEELEADILGHPSLSEVLDAADVAQELAVRRVQRQSMRAQPAQLDPGRMDAVLVDPLSPSSHDVAPRRRHALAFLGRDDEAPDVALEVLQRLPRELAPALVDERDVAARIGAED